MIFEFSVVRFFVVLFVLTVSVTRQCTRSRSVSGWTGKVHLKRALDSLERLVNGAQPLFQITIRVSFPHCKAHVQCVCWQVNFLVCFRPLQ